MAQAAAEVLTVLADSGYDSFIVGGTLLGAIREGAILPHDDDADVAYLSEFSHPSDLVVEGHRIDAILAEAGFTAIRHSWSHVQVLTKATSGVTDFYVDIFTAFYKDGFFNEPIHMRNRGLDEAILPLSSVTMHGLGFPAPADPEAWLAACYGSDWRVPQPGFEFLTPSSTKRRFDSWFSSFNQHRHFWNDLHAAGDSPPSTTVVRHHVASAQRSDTREILDLGSGAGADLAWYEEQGWIVHPVDYSWFAASRSHPNFSLINLANYTESSPFLSQRMGEILDRTGKPPLVVLNHLLAGLDGFGRPNMLRLAAFLVRQGAELISADYADLGEYEFSDPMTWHYPFELRRRDAHSHGLSVELLEQKNLYDSAGIARTAEVVVYKLSDDESETHL